MLAAIVQSNNPDVLCFQRPLDHVEEAGAGGLEEVGDFEPEHDVGGAATRIDLFEQEDPSIDEDRHGLPVGEGSVPPTALDGGKSLEFPGRPIEALHHLLSESGQVHDLPAPL